MAASGSREKTEGTGKSQKSGDGEVNMMDIYILLTYCFGGIIAALLLSGGIVFLRFQKRFKLQEEMLQRYRKNKNTFVKRADIPIRNLRGYNDSTLF